MNQSALQPQSPYVARLHLTHVTEIMHFRCLSTYWLELRSAEALSLLV